MKKTSFILLTLLLASLSNTALAKPLNRFFANPKIDTKVLQNKCSNTCLSNYADILRCSSSKIIIEDLLQNELEDEHKK